MKQIVISTGTITYALKGRDLLRNNNYSASVARRNSALGCGYVILAKGEAEKISELLLNNEIKILDISEEIL